MEFDKLKVVSPDKDENKSHAFVALIVDVFDHTESGKKLLALLKEKYVSDRYSAAVFPGHPGIWQQYGTPEVYAGFKSGQANVIFQIEEMIFQYKQEERIDV